MSEDIFAKALRNFTMDAAAGDAIRHLCDRSYTPSQIKQSLTFPAPMDQIINVMWDHLVSKGTVLFDNFSNRQDDTGKSAPAQSPVWRSGETPGHEIVEMRDRYGRKSFLSVKKESPEEEHSPEDYEIFDKAAYIAEHGVTDNEFINLLPWPQGAVLVLKEFLSVML